MAKYIKQEIIDPTHPFMRLDDYVVYNPQE